MATHARPENYVRVTFKLVGGKSRTIWAKKLASSDAKISQYIQVKQDGEDYSYERSDGVIVEPKHIFIVATEDVIREQPAHQNLKYGDLEVIGE